MKQFLKRRFGLTDQGSKDLVKSSILSFLVFVANMLPAILLMFIFDALLLEHIRDTAVYITFSLIIIIIIYVVLNMEYGALYNATYKESENMRVEIARHLTKLPLSYFSKHNLSDLAQTIMQDVAAIEHALSHAIAKLIAFIAFFVLMSIMLIASNPILALVIILPILLNFILLGLAKKLLVKQNKKYYMKLRDNSEEFQEAIELQQEIRSFGKTQEMKDSLYQSMDEAEKLHIEVELGTGVAMNIAGSLLYLCLAGVIVVGTMMYLKGEISILYLLGYLLAAIKLKDAADSINMIIAEVFYLDPRIERINDMRDVKLQEGEAVDLESFDIKFSDVGFSYKEDTPILQSLSFVAKQGEVTALVGKSGCGKTSVLRLISRLYDYDEGSIEIGGRDIKDISIESLFAKMSIVFQDVSLFDASALENIRLGNLSASDEEVKEAARLANCEDFILKLEQGYDTKIGENGASLSGGERQRISIARAFLKNADIIILDEISASLDVGNEKKIQESLNRLTKGKTVIIISHRLKSIENVDKIVVINEGKVEASGKHYELLQNSPTYKALIEGARLAEEFSY